MKKTKITIAVLLSLCFLICLAGLTGCAGPQVSRTSAYQGDNFLFSAERFQVSAHDLFIEFYRWEASNRANLPVAVSRWADYCRKNEKGWMGTIDALHDAYTATPSTTNKDKYSLALNEARAALGQAAYWMGALEATAPNSGLADAKTLAVIGVKTVPPPST